MTARGRTPADKVSDWYVVFNAVRAELTSDATRKTMEALSVTDVAGLQFMQRLAQIVNANDRAAALVAAMLTSSGIRPVPVAIGDEEDG